MKSKLRDTSSRERLSQLDAGLLVPCSLDENHKDPYRTSNRRSQLHKAMSSVHFWC